MGKPIYLRLLLICILITIQGRFVHSTSSANSKSSQHFPPLYNFDNYDNCLNNKYSEIASTYCMVYAEIKPKNSSQLWQRIEQHTNEHKFHYRRDHLFIGLCMDRCTAFPKSQKSFSYKEEILNNDITKYFGNVHKRPLDLQMRSEYQELVHNCLNNEFEENYDLNLKTFIEYCERPEGIKDAQETKEIDFWEKFLYKILQIILLLNILSSLYDLCLQRKLPEEMQNNEFFKINPQQRVSRLLTTFSLQRNVNRIIQPYHTAEGKSLSFLDGFRSVCMIISICGHMFFAEFQHVLNPEYYENFIKNPKSTWSFNATQIIEIFYVMSGLLLCIKFYDLGGISPKSSLKECLKVYIQGTIFRFLRFLPSLGLFVLVNATVFQRLQDGPFWRHVTESNHVYSREIWWKNIFMFNNINITESSYHHTWYLATDCQLFSFYFMILIVIAKYPNLKKYIYSTLAALSFLVPFTITYIMKLEPCFIMAPENYRYGFFKDVGVYDQIYIKFYTNLAGYLFGIISGELFLKYARTEEKRQQSREFLLRFIKTDYVFWLAVPIAFLICWLGSRLILQESSIWTAVYGGLYRILWILFVCGLPLCGMCCKFKSVAHDFCCLTIFRILARLSFQIYLWQFSILYIINATQRLPFTASFTCLTTQCISVIFLSIALSVIISVFVEIPFTQTLQVLHSKKKDIKKA